MELGIVLQGGGALGAYECGAVTALLELMDESAAGGQPIELKVVTGTSIGAINGACVVGAADRADARARLLALWDDLALETPPFWSADAQRDLSLFGLPGFYTTRSDLWRMSSWTNVYDTAPLAATLARHVDFGALNRSATTFAVTAVDVGTGEIAVFASKPLGKAEPIEITAEHVKASGSLPPAFPWAMIGGRPYWDGGIVDNTPLGTAIDGFSVDEGVTRLLVVMNLFPLRADLPGNLSGVDDRASELRFGNRMRQDRKSAERINTFVQTIEALVDLVPPGAIPGPLQAGVDKALAYKLVETIDVDFQDPLGDAEPARQPRFDDDLGFRDYSVPTVRARRERGHAIATAKLRPFFESHGLLH